MDSSSFNNLFKGLRFEELLQCVPSRVTAEMNGDLMKEYTDEEIK